MKKYNIILTTNDVAKYLSFWATATNHWKNNGFNVILGFITNRTENDVLVQKIKSYVDELHLFKPINDINSGNQSKVTRMYLSTLYEDSYNIIMDLDMFVFNVKYCLDNWWSKANDENFIAVGRELYNNGKFPMSNTCAKGSIFKEIVNPKSLNYNDLLKTWYDVNVFDSKESLKNPLADRNYSVDCFSDESLLKVLLYRWNNKNNILYLNRGVNIKETRLEGDLCSITDLENNKYFDCFPKRPLNKSNLKLVLDFLNICEKNRNI